MAQQTTLGVQQVDLPDWRWLLGTLRTRFETRSFGVGAAFVADVARLADAVNHPPDVELRPRHVGLVLRDRDAGGVTERDVRLAERISTLASDHGLVSQPEQVQVLELALDTPVTDTVRPFWAALLSGGEVAGNVVDPAGKLPPLWFQRTESTAPDRQRFHIDVTVPPESADQRISAAIAAGGRIVDDSHSPAFVVLADPDGNNACVCTELGRG